MTPLFFVARIYNNNNLRAPGTFLARVPSWGRSLLGIPIWGRFLLGKYSLLG
jgi:hypothetical protein